MRSKSMRSDVTNRAERKCAAAVMVWMFTWESREKWQIKRADRLFSAQRTAPALSADRYSYSGNPSLRLRISLANSWNCNCTNCCINTVNMFKDWKSVAAKYDSDMKSKAARAPLFAGKTEPVLFTADILWKEIQVRNTRTHVHTTGIGDRSQVITTLTSSNCSLKCLPPDWPKRLSNGSSSKPRHMPLGNK